MKKKDMILFDKDLKRIADLNYESIIDPVIIQDLQTGIDHLNFKYPVKDVQSLELTWMPYADFKWEDLETVSWYGDWSAYDIQFDWTRTFTSVGAGTWHTFVNISGEGLLNFVRIFGNSGELSVPAMEIIVDGVTYLFGVRNVISGTSASWVGNTLYEYIHFRESLQIRGFNSGAVAISMACDYTIMMLDNVYNRSKDYIKDPDDDILMASINTNSTSFVSFLNIVGSGYLLGVIFQANRSTGNGSLAFNMVLDGVTEVNNRPMVASDTSEGAQYQFVGPIRFDSDLLLSARTTGSGTFARALAIYILD